MRSIHIGADSFMSTTRNETIYFHNFSRLCRNAKDFVDSPPFTAHGHEWYVKLYARGRDPKKAQANRSHVACYLYLHERSKKIAKECIAQFSIEIPMLNAKQSTLATHDFVSSTEGWGWEEFTERKYVMEKGRSGDTLTILVSISIRCQRQPVYTPRATLQHDYLSIIGDKSFADVTVLVGPDVERIQLSRSVLKHRVPTLASMIDTMKPSAAGCSKALVVDTSTTTKDDPGNATQTSSVADGGVSLFPALQPVNLVPVFDDIPPLAFKTMLRYACTEDGSIITNEQRPRDLLLVAYQLGCWRLKTLLEKKLIEEELRPELSIDLLLFAHIHCCFMLKEAAMEMILKEADTILSHSDFKKLVASKAVLQEVVDKIRAKRCGSLLSHQVAGNQQPQDKYSGMALCQLYDQYEVQGGEIGSSMTREQVLKRIRSSSANDG